MKQIIEFLPIIIFAAIFFYTKDIFLATLVLIISLFIQICLEYVIDQNIPKKSLIIFFITLIFGGSALVFKNEQFLFWRPTIINWIFSLFILLSQMIWKKSLLKLFFVVPLLKNIFSIFLFEETIFCVL